jgi:hypothetical protein
MGFQLNHLKQGERSNTLTDFKLETMSPSPSNTSLKRKWGERGCNKMSSGITYVATLDLNGLPTEPPEARRVFKHACRFQVRDNVSITIQNWRLMPKTTKEQVWRNIT